MTIRPRPLGPSLCGNLGRIVTVRCLIHHRITALSLDNDRLIVSFFSSFADDRELNHRTGDNEGASKELPTRTKKERRRHERHHELLSTAARARKEYDLSIIS